MSTTNLESDSSRTDTDAVDEDGSTDTTQTRHWLTNDALAAWLLVSFVLTVAAGGLGWIDLGAVPWQWTYPFVLLALGAGTWVFGVGLLEAYGSR